MDEEAKRLRVVLNRIAGALMDGDIESAKNLVSDELELSACDRCGKELQKDEEYKCSNRTYSLCEERAGIYCRECVEEFNDNGTDTYYVCRWCLGSE